MIGIFYAILHSLVGKVIDAEILIVYDYYYVSMIQISLLWEVTDVNTVRETLKFKQFKGVSFSTKTCYVTPKTGIFYTPPTACVTTLIHYRIGNFRIGPSQDIPDPHTLNPWHNMFMFPELQTPNWTFTKYLQDFLNVSSYSAAFCGQSNVIQYLHYSDFETFELNPTTSSRVHIEQISQQLHIRIYCKRIESAPQCFPISIEV